MSVAISSSQITTLELNRANGVTMKLFKVIELCGPIQTIFNPTPW